MHYIMNILQHRLYPRDRRIYLFMKHRMNSQDGNESYVQEHREGHIKLMNRKIDMMIDENGCSKAICLQHGVEEVE